jgi:cytochrome c556
MSYRKLPVAVLVTSLAATSIAAAGDSPQHQRHELMEGVGDAAKVIGGMLRGKVEYDAAAVMDSLQTFDDASAKLGDLFPAGTETGEGTEAAPAIWEDREGFNAALQDWADAVDAAIAASPATLEKGKPILSPIFQTCKGCHDTYRIEDE